MLLGNAGPSPRWRLSRNVSLLLTKRWYYNQLNCALECVWEKGIFMACAFLKGVSSIPCKWGPKLEMTVHVALKMCLCSRHVILKFQVCRRKGYRWKTWNLLLDGEMITVTMRMPKVTGSTPGKRITMYNVRYCD